MSIAPELLAAIERNQKWIKQKCKLSEKDASKCEDLEGEVYLNLVESNKYFITHAQINADAWIKKITTNTTSSYITEQVREKSVITENIDNIEGDHESKAEANHDLQRALDYIKTQMNQRDREIMSLYFMKESQSSIAEIIGLEVATITNKISLLKKELNEYLNKGQI